MHEGTSRPSSRSGGICVSLLCSGPGVSQARCSFSLPLSRRVFAAQQPGLRPGVPVEQQRERQGGAGVRAPRGARRARHEPRAGGRRVAAGPGGTAAAAFWVCLFSLGVAGDGRGVFGFFFPGAGRDARFPRGRRGASPLPPGLAGASCRDGSAMPPPPVSGAGGRRRG